MGRRGAPGDARAACGIVRPPLPTLPPPSQTHAAGAEAALRSRLSDAQAEAERAAARIAGMVGDMSAAQADAEAARAALAAAEARCDELQAEADGLREDLAGLLAHRSAGQQAGAAGRELQAAVAVVADLRAALSRSEARCASLAREQVRRVVVGELIHA